MRIETIKTNGNKTRYILIDDHGELIVPVMHFLKFKDNCGRARNTLRAYCFHLKFFFEYLEFIEKQFYEIGIDELAGFLRYLQKNEEKPNVISIVTPPPKRTARTINIYLSSVYEFYDYAMRHEEYSIRLTENLKRKMSVSRRGFKDFLYHINKSKYFDTKLIRLKEPKMRIKTVSKENISVLIQACHTVRDKLLIQLLWESGMRISEALSLWLEDFEPDAKRIHINDRGELENLAEIKTVCSPRIIDVSSDLINLYFDYISDIHTDEVDTNFVFIKQSGNSKFKPMEYSDVSALVLRLRKRTGIYFSAHTLRHTSFTQLRRLGWEIEKIQKRAGHVCVQSTYIYLHHDDADMHEEWLAVENEMKLKKSKEMNK